MKFILNLLKKFKELQISDPVKHCNVYKESGCSHVDGYLCDFHNCKIRKEQELFEEERKFGIGFKDSYYNRNK